MQILFLCGGLGTRLKTINPILPKGLVNINNLPFFDYIIESIQKYRPTSFHFCLGYGSRFFIDYINQLKYKIKITYSCEDDDNLLGTGGAIKKSLNYLDDNFIVQYGDSILNFDYNDLYTFHIEKNFSMTMTILRKDKSSENPNMYCIKNKNGEFNCIYEKKEIIKNANFIDYGAIVFKKTVFELKKELKFDLSDIQSSLSYSGDSSFFEVDKPYIEIGTPESYKKASYLLSK